MNRKTKLSSLAVIVLALAFGFASLVAIAKNDNSSSKSSKTSQSQGKDKTTKANLKNFEKADKTTGRTNAQVHREKTQAVIQNLGQVAIQEESAGNTAVSNDVSQVVQEQEQAQEQTTEAIEQVEKRGKWKTFLIGTDYKNIGQLRSSLVHNRNQIRKLTRTMAQVQAGGDTTLLQAQLETLMQERERIKTIITTNESSFSLLGWVSRFLFNYEQTPINEQEETQLTTEVEDAISVVPASDEGVLEPAPPVTTGATTP
jgi:hypothetical protein